MEGSGSNTKMFAQFGVACEIVTKGFKVKYLYLEKNYNSYKINNSDIMQYKQWLQTLSCRFYF